MSAETAPKPFAAFDVDGTIFKSSLVEKAVESCIAAKLFDPEAFTDTFELREQLHDDNNEPGYQTYVRRLVDGFIEQIEGVKVADFNEVAAQMLAKHRVRKFAFPRKVMNRLRDTHYLVAISASPAILVEPFLEDMEFNAIYGSEYALSRGKFTGVAHPVGDKVTILDALIDHDIMLQVGSVAIGDTVADVPMLHRAEKAVMFNPSSTLKGIGEHQQWYDVMEQKDTITVLAPSRHGKSYHEITTATLLNRLQAPAQK